MRGTPSACAFLYNGAPMSAVACSIIDNRDETPVLHRDETPVLQMMEQATADISAAR